MKELESVFYPSCMVCAGLLLLVGALLSWIRFSGLDNQSEIDTRPYIAAFGVATALLASGLCGRESFGIVFVVLVLLILYLLFVH